MASAITSDQINSSLIDTISLTSTVLTGLGGGSSPITHYKVEHLLTFSSENKLKNATRINSEVYQKVANLEKQNKLFIQDIIIHVDNVSVKLLDHESFNTVENFSFKRNQLVSVFDLTGKFKTVNSLLVLVTCENQKNTSVFPDVHVLQCAQRMHTASIIRKDILAALNDFRTMVKLQLQAKKKSSSKTKSRSSTIISERQSVLLENRSVLESIPPNPPGPPPDIPKSVSDMSDTEKVKFNTRLVNSCFDDIEFFCNKLYKVADAMRQYKKAGFAGAAQKGGSQSKRKTQVSQPQEKAPNQGVLQLRAQPPKEEEYIAIFKKIKFSLNIMAELEGKVLNPTPSEMFRHLQQPFIFIVQSTGGTSLANSIKYPILTRASLDMIYRVTESTPGSGSSTVVSTSDWIELGESWNKPFEEHPMVEQRESEKYIPFFNSGWSPINQYKTQEELANHPSMKETPREKALDPAIPRKAVVMQAWLSNMPRELSVAFGDQVDVLDGSSDWWKCRNSKGVVGYVPHTILEYLDDFVENLSRSANNTVVRNKSEPKTFEFACRQFKNGNLDIDPEDRVGIIEKKSGGEWLVKDTYGNKGLCPANVFEEAASQNSLPVSTPKVLSTFDSPKAASVPTVMIKSPKSVPPAGTGAPIPPPLAPNLKTASTTEDNSIPKNPPPVNSLYKLVDRRKAIKDYKNEDIKIIKGSTINVYSMDGRWWKVSGSRLGIGFAPKDIFEQKPEDTKKAVKKTADTVSLSSVRSEFQNDIINKNFKLKKVNKSEESSSLTEQDSGSRRGGAGKGKPLPPLPSTPSSNKSDYRVTLRTPTTTETEDLEEDNRVSVRRRPSKNTTANIAVISKVQRPEMTQLINSISERIEGENRPKYQARGNRKSLTGQELMITTKSTEADVKRWLGTIGDISDVTVDALSALNGSLLFQLTTDDLQQICDNDWHRIYGHINIQKNLFEKSHASALELKLQQRRKKNQEQIGISL